MIFNLYFGVSRCLDALWFIHRQPCKSKLRCQLALFLSESCFRKKRLSILIFSFTNMYLIFDMLSRTFRHNFFISSEHWGGFVGTYTPENIDNSKKTFCCHCKGMNFIYFWSGLITLPRLIGSNNCFFKVPDEVFHFWYYTFLHALDYQTIKATALQRYLHLLIISWVILISCNWLLLSVNSM